MSVGHRGHLQQSFVETLSCEYLCWTHCVFKQRERQGWWRSFIFSNYLVGFDTHLSCVSLDMVFMVWQCLTYKSFIGLVMWCCISRQISCLSHYNTIVCNTTEIYLKKSYSDDIFLVINPFKHDSVFTLADSKLLQRVKTDASHQ